MTAKIFISYRRSDSDAVAHRMFDWLVEQFGPDAVFIDIDRIPAGAEWRAEIAVQVRAANVVLVVIAETWLETLHARADDPKDVLRLEIETALAAGKPIIPVLIERADMPGYGQLPAWAARLPDFNAARVSKTNDFKVHMERLGARLAEGFGFRRVVAAPGIVGKARPATADLVVASRFTGPVLPPPKVGEKWEIVQIPNPKNFHNRVWSRESFRGKAKGIWFHSDWQIGYFDIAMRKFASWRPFHWSEWIYPAIKKNQEPHRSVEFLSDGASAFYGDTAIFANSDFLCSSREGGRYDLLTAPNRHGFGYKGSGRDHPLITAVNDQNKWVFIRETEYAKQSAELAKGRKAYSTWHIYHRDEIVSTCDSNFYIGSRDWTYSWSPSNKKAIMQYGLWGGCASLITLDAPKVVCALNIFDDENKRYVIPFPNDNNQSHGPLVWHPARDLFATTSCRNRPGSVEVDNWHLSIYDANSLDLLHTTAIEERRDGVKSTSCNSTGRFVATGGGSHCIFVWDLLTGDLRQLFGHDAEIEHIEFSPDGQRLATFGGGQLIIWDPIAGERVASWQGRPSGMKEAWGDASLFASSNDGLEIRRLVV